MQNNRTIHPVECGGRPQRNMSTTLCPLEDRGGKTTPAPSISFMSTNTSPGSAARPYRLRRTVPDPDTAQHNIGDLSVMNSTTAATSRQSETTRSAKCVSPGNPLQPQRVGQVTCTGCVVLTREGRACADYGSSVSDEGTEKTGDNGCYPRKPVC